MASRGAGYSSISWVWIFRSNMPLFGLLWGVTGLTAVGRYLIIGVAGLFALGFVVNGIVAPYKRDIARLEGQNKKLLDDNAKSERLAEEDSSLASADEQELASLRQKVREFTDAAASRGDTCRLSPVELQQLKSAASGG